MVRTRAVSEALVNTQRFGLLCALLLRDMGFDLGQVVMDRPRLRCTPALPCSAPLSPLVYGAHRDTWFGEPEAQVNLWLSPYEVGSNQTFVFFQDYFLRPIENSSSSFDLLNEVKASTGAHPAPTVPIGGRAIGFSADAGEVVLFSAAQLHQTIRNSSEQHRFALQLRVVDPRDIAEQTKMLRIDNFSSGSTFYGMHSLDWWARDCRD